jgi:hypothetical protein
LLHDIQSRPLEELKMDDDNKKYGLLGKLDELGPKVNRGHLSESLEAPLQEEVTSKEDRPPRERFLD